ncbi:helix-turn-helix transcriptional regulator [Elstera litoralis]
MFYLGEHYAQPVSLDELASHAHVSRSHLSFLFRTELHTAFKTLLGRLRVQKASELLSTDLRQPITDVAMSVGFADLSHFEKSFRRQWGKSPREFRRGIVAATPVPAHRPLSAPAR